MSEALCVKIVQLGLDSVVVNVIGDFANSHVASLKRKVLKSIRRLTSGRVIFELSETSYIDSMGIAALLELRHEMKAKGLHVKIQNPGVGVRRLFEETNLYNYLEVEG